MNSLAEAFLALRLSTAGVPVTTEQRQRALTDARSFTGDLCKTAAKTAVVRHADPLTFILRFLAALDGGITPVAVAPDASASASIALPEDAPGAPSVYACLTSGSTGAPRRSLLSLEGARENAVAHAHSLGIGPDDTLVQSLPVHHAFGLVAYVFTPLSTGCALDLNSTFVTPRGLRKRNLARAILHASPATARFFLKDTQRIDSETATPRVLSVGAATIARSELDALQRLLPDTEIYVTYGLTEAGPRVTTGRVGVRERPTGWVGTALPGVTLRVRCDGAGEAESLAASGRGLLAVRSPALAQGLALVDGFYVTRDQVTLDEDGVLLHGRVDDLMKTGGVSVYPGAIEARMRACPGVVDCFVLRRTDPVYEDVFDLVAEGTATSEEIASFAASQLTLPERPRAIHCVPALPRTALGKVDRARVDIMIGGPHAGVDRCD